MLYQGLCGNEVAVLSRACLCKRAQKGPWMCQSSTWQRLLQYLGPLDGRKHPPQHIAAGDAPQLSHTPRLPLPEVLGSEVVLGSSDVLVSPAPCNRRELR